VYEHMPKHGPVRLGRAEALRPSPVAVARLGTVGAGDGVYRLAPIYVESTPDPARRER
jgi:hypothetical protein